MWWLLLIPLLSGCLGAAPPAAPPSPGSDAAWTAVVNVINKDCVTCHNGSQEPLLTPSAVFLASSAKSMLTSNAMPPPPKTISAGDKQVLLDYLNQN